MPEITITTAATQTTNYQVTPVIGKYVTSNNGFVSHLLAVREQISNYIAKSKITRPLNILLAAPPGSGKSFLIKQLIKSLDSKYSNAEVSFEEVYIASLEDASELYSIFQRIQSLNLEGRLPVVFFDEVDSEVRQQFMYPKFLAPMWDGTFYVGKDKFFLGRSIFFFAGSTLSLETESNEIINTFATSPVAQAGGKLSYSEYFDKWSAKLETRSQEISEKDGSKLTDFMDRIDAIIRIPPICKELLGEDGLNREYLDISMMLIKKHFPDVNNIGKIAIANIVDILRKSKSLRPAEKTIFGSSGGSGIDTFDLSSLPASLRNSLQKNDRLLEGGQETEVYTVEIK